MKKPNFFIIGAPKCGTTSMYHWLKHHPEVYMSPKKEPHFFYNPYEKPMSLEDYEALFSEATDKHIAIGEASIWYLFSKNAVKKILEYQPKSKFIVLLRNPIEMAQSLHNQKRATGHELEDDFEKAWRLNEIRSAGEPIKIFGLQNKEHVDYSHMNYKITCRIGTQLEKLFSLINKDKVLIVFLDDIKNEPQSEYNRVLNFLNLSCYDLPKFSVKNRAKERKSYTFHRMLYRISGLKKFFGLQEKSTGLLRWLWDLNTKRKEKTRLDKGFRIELKNVFEPEIQKIENLLRVDLSEWREFE